MFYLANLQGVQGDWHVSTMLEKSYVMERKVFYDAKGQSQVQNKLFDIYQTVSILISRYNMKRYEIVK